ncbi:MAG: cell filamentation protein Fic [Candidatus Margulisbacteria bacterium GWF2_35_9]|nr:MAG: cell filamentation protein Fic [Candidatus Margulisbacteria bacterium GWF2_35_9]
MNIEQSPSGHILKNSQGYSTFVPHPLPPPIFWDAEVINSLSRADFLLGKLAMQGSSLPNPYLLIRSFVAREAVLSSRIEGTQTTLGDLLSAEVAASTNQNLDDLQEVQNYIKALTYGLERLKELPLSLRLIQEIHQILMEGVRGARAHPGEFRNIQNWIGLPGCTVHTAKFVPPAPEYVINCLHDLELFFHNRQLPPLIHIALCHYQFETIHPFLDGNGRIGRLLIILLLIEHNVLPSPLLYISAFMEATRNEYYQQLFNVSKDGTWNEWLMYFLHGVATQAEDALKRIERINTLLDTWKQLVVHSSSPVAEKIIQQLAANPYTSVKKMAEILNIAYSTAQRGIQKLESKGIIIKVTKQKRDCVYCAIELLNILKEPASVNS